MAERVTACVIVLAVLLAVLWAPWFTPQHAERLALEAFNAVWNGIIDGCGFNCQGCGVKMVQRVLTGYAVHIEYACGLLPQDTPAFHETRVVHVSVLGGVRGLPRP